MGNKRPKAKPEKAKNLISKFGEIDGREVLYPTTGFLHAISWEIGVVVPSVGLNIKLYDGSKNFLSMDTKKLAQAVKDLRQPLLDKGITWEIPLFQHSIEVNHRMLHNLQIEGKFDGLIFWIEGQAIGS